MVNKNYEDVKSKGKIIVDVDKCIHYYESMLHATTSAAIRRSIKMCLHCGDLKIWELKSKKVLNSKEASEATREYWLKKCRIFSQKVQEGKYVLLDFYPSKRENYKFIEQVEHPFPPELWDLI